MRVKLLQHAQISAATYGGDWTDYVEARSFLDSSKATCTHFKHRFLLHHAEGIELGIKIFGETIRNSEGREISTRRILTEHLIEDVGRVVTVEDWARGLLPDPNDSFHKLLAKKREQIGTGGIRGERELTELLQSLAGELPKTKALWEQILAPPRADGFSGNDQQWLLASVVAVAGDGEELSRRAGVNLPSPNVKKKRGTRLPVTLGTSGSIDADLLERFLAEIAALCKLSQRSLILLIGDYLKITQSCCSENFINVAEGWIAGYTPTQGNLSPKYGQGVISQTTNGGTDWNLTEVENSERFFSNVRLRASRLAQERTVDCFAESEV